MMKKIILFLSMTVILTGMVFSGCAKNGSGTTSSQESHSKARSTASESVSGSRAGKSLQIVTTIFPAYDWVMQVLGKQAGQAKVTMLSDQGVDLHSYQPSAKDISRIKSCDIFVYVGGESDTWVKKALKQPENKNRRVICLMDALKGNVLEEEVKKGMTKEKEEEKGDTKDEEPEYDEHIWLSLNKAATLTNAIAAQLQQLDPDHAAMYRENASRYISRLTKLKQQYQNVVDRAGIKTLVFGDRFPFRYLVEETGLQYEAAFVGCSAETEASFETISFLAKKVDQLGLRYVMTIDGSDHNIARAIIRNTKNKDRKILTLDSMQSVHASDIKKGKTYLGTMKSNLRILKKALQKEKDR